MDNAVAAVILSHHLSSEHPAPARKKAPTIPQPKVTGNIYEDKWDSFTREWLVYKGTVEIPAGQLPVYLLACCSQELKESVEKADPTISTQSEAAVLTAIKRHAVVSVAASVLRTELLSMKQDHGETVLAFSSRALGKARNCKLTVRCPHNSDVDYSEEMVKQVVIAGMYDEEIKLKVLSTVGIDDKSLNETVGIIETEEMASRSMLVASESSQAGATSFKKQILPSDKRLKLKGICATCRSEFLKHRIKKGGIDKEDVLLTDKHCKPCWQKRREKRTSTGQPSTQTKKSGASGFAAADEFPYLAAVEETEDSNQSSYI